MRLETQKSCGVFLVMMTLFMLRAPTIQGAEIWKMEFSGTVAGFHDDNNLIPSLSVGSRFRGEYRYDTAPPDDSPLQARGDYSFAPGYELLLEVEGVTLSQPLTRIIIFDDLPNSQLFLDRIFVRSGGDPATSPEWSEFWIDERGLSPTLVSNTDIPVTTPDLNVVTGSAFGFIMPGLQFGGSNTIDFVSVSQTKTDVQFDIKPGSDKNPINLKSRGVLSAAVLSSVDFDVAQIDTDTLLFGDPLLSGLVQPVRTKFDDINSDDLIDLSLFFSMQDIVSQGALGPTSIEAALTGTTFGGIDFVGSDLVSILHPAKSVPEPESIFLLLLGCVLFRYAPGPTRRAGATRDGQG